MQNRGYPGTLRHAQCIAWDISLAPIPNIAAPEGGGENKLPRPCDIIVRCPRRRLRAEQIEERRIGISDQTEMSEEKRQARSRSTLIVPVKQGNSPEGPCRGKGGEHYRSLRGA